MYGFLCVGSGHLVFLRRIPHSNLLFLSIVTFYILSISSCYFITLPQPSIKVPLEEYLTVISPFFLIQWKDRQRINFSFIFLCPHRYAYTPIMETGLFLIIISSIICIHNINYWIPIFNSFFIVFMYHYTNSGLCLLSAVEKNIIPLVFYTRSLFLRYYLQQLYINRHIFVFLSCWCFLFISWTFQHPKFIVRFFCRGRFPLDLFEFRGFRMKFLAISVF